MRKKKKNNRYKSGLEERVADYLTQLGIPFRYEPFKISYIQPEITRSYCPDFVPENCDNFIIEVKGRLTASDRKKYEHFRKSNPEITIVFLFERATEKIRKGSKTTYADWAEKNGFEWADFRHGIPKKWVRIFKYGTQN